MAKDQISIDFVKKLCGSNKDQIHMLTDQELGIFTRAICNYYLLDKPKEPDFKDRFLTLLWKRLVVPFNKYLNTEDVPAVVEKPKHQRIEVKAKNVELVYTTSPVANKTEVEELDPELIYKEDQVDDQTQPNVELTEPERKLLNAIIKCKEKYGTDADGGFKAPAIELRDVIRGGGDFRAARNGLVNKGLIKYEFVKNEKKLKERRYWLLNGTPAVKPVAVDVPEKDIELSDEEQMLLWHIQNSHGKKASDGYYRAPIKYLDGVTGLGYHQIAVLKASLKDKGYIDYKIGEGRYHYYKVIKGYNFKKTA